jgi:SAM-dependent methyltransferase
MAGPEPEAKTFWDARAKEDAFFFVDNRLDYGNPDEASFWTEGEKDLETLLTAVGAHVEATDVVLDIGCGIGRLTRALAARASEVLAIDVSPRMLELARRYNDSITHVTWIEGDGVSLAGVEDESVDACISHVVFQHIPDPQTTLGYVREIGRVLRPGGWAVFQFSNDPAIHKRRPGWRHRVRALLGLAPRGQAHRNWRGSHVEINALRAAVEEGGMHIEAITGEGTLFCVVRTSKKP